MARTVTLNATVTVKVPKGIKTSDTEWGIRYIKETLMNKNRVQTYDVSGADANGSISDAAPSQQADAGELAQG